jgi:hypothetical protein
MHKKYVYCRQYITNSRSCINRVAQKSIGTVFLLLNIECIILVTVSVVK